MKNYNNEFLFSSNLIYLLVHCVVCMLTIDTSFNKSILLCIVLCFVWHMKLFLQTSNHLINCIIYTFVNNILELFQNIIQFSFRFFF